MTRRDGIDELYSLDQGPTLSLHKVDPETGGYQRTAAIPNSTGGSGIIVDDKVLLLDGATATLFDGYTGNVVWRVASSQSANNWAGAWDGSAHFTAPYTSLRLSDGALEWTTDGCCTLTRGYGELTAVSQEGRVALVDKDGSVSRACPGELVTAGRAGLVTYDHGAYVACFMDDATPRALELKAKPAAGAATLDAGTLFYVDEAGLVWEHDLSRKTSVLVYRPRQSRSARTDIFVPPVVVGDRIYVDDEGWVALDRRPSRAPIRDVIAPR